MRAACTAACQVGHARAAHSPPEPPCAAQRYAMRPHGTSRPVPSDLTPPPMPQVWRRGVRPARSWRCSFMLVALVALMSSDGSEGEMPAQYIQGVGGPRTEDRERPFDPARHLLMSASSDSEDDVERAAATPAQPDATPAQPERSWPALNSTGRGKYCRVTPKLSHAEQRHAYLVVVNSSALAGKCTPGCNLGCQGRVYCVCTLFRHVTHSQKNDSIHAKAQSPARAHLKTQPPAEKTQSPGPKRAGRVLTYACAFASSSCAHASCAHRCRTLPLP